jgi:hypothetical protein
MPAACRTRVPGGGRGLRRGSQPHGLADTGLAGHHEGPAVGSGRGHERADPVDLRLPPDQIRGLSAIALPFVELRDVGACHERWV